MRKILSAIAIAVCASTPVHAVDIEVGYPYSHLFDVTFEKIMKDFKQQHPDINVKFRAVYEGYEEGTNIILREAISGKV
jgi:multiple sugar transport system substrate-binding protein